MTLGDHLRTDNVGCWLIGKTHMKADAKGMARRGLAPDSVIGARLAECGFDVWCRDDGLWAEGPDGFYDVKRSPYNEMYAAADVPPANRHIDGLTAPHPVYAAFTNGRVGKTFSKDHVREKVIPAYMSLITQCDDQMGRPFAYLEETGQADDTMIIITSDHGDHLGDQWMGEKDLFHDPSVKIPLIIYDPRAQANGIRGTNCDALVARCRIISSKGGL